MASGGHFLEQYQTKLSTVSGEQFATTHESFVRELARRQDDPTAGLDSAERAHFAAFFSQCQRRYLAIKEKQESETMMTVVDGATVSAIMDIAFGRDAYDRVADLIGMVPTYRNLVMWGVVPFRLHCSGCAITSRELTIRGWTSTRGASERRRN